MNTINLNFNEILNESLSLESNKKSMKELFSTKPENIYTIFHNADDFGKNEFANNTDYINSKPHMVVGEEVIGSLSKSEIDTFNKRGLDLKSQAIIDMTSYKHTKFALYYKNDNIGIICICDKDETDPEVKKEIESIGRFNFLKRNILDFFTKKEKPVDNTPSKTNTVINNAKKIDNQVINQSE